MVATSFNACASSAAALEDGQRGQVKQGHRMALRQQRRRALLQKLHHCEARAEEHDSGLRSFVKGVDVEQWYAMVLQHTISCVTHRQKMIGTHHKSPEKESRSRLREVRRQIGEMVQSVDEANKINEEIMQADKDLLNAENDLALADQREAEASARRYLVEEQIDFRWCDERKPVDGHTNAKLPLTATQKRMLLEKRLEMRLDALQEPEQEPEQEPWEVPAPFMIPEAAATSSAPAVATTSVSPMYADILQTIDQIEQRGVPRHDRSSWTEFKGLMHTINKIQLIGQNSAHSQIFSPSIFAIDV